MKKIGRIHWLLHNLPKRFKAVYHIRYDYALHNYCFWQHRGFKLLDCFIVIRTSKKCFRVMYFNYEYNIIKYFSCKKSIDTADKMYQIYLYYNTS